jgi:hypothetical protein
VISELEPPAKRGLTQRGAALALGLGLLAIPAVPAIADAVLPEQVWETAVFDQMLTITSADGISVTATPPAGWQVHDLGTSAVLRDGNATVLFQVYDLEGRDPHAVALRLMRASRLDGISTTLDGGFIATAQGTLTGDTCIAVTAEATGTCAYLTDGEVLVSVVSLGASGSPSVPLGSLVGPLDREQS